MEGVNLKCINIECNFKKVPENLWKNNDYIYMLNTIFHEKTIIDTILETNAVLKKTVLSNLSTLRIIF